MRRKVILAISAFVLLIILAGVASLIILVTQNSQRLPAWVTLPDGSSVRIITATYGTNHVIGTKLGQNIAALPVGLQNILKRVFGHRALPMQKTATPPELLVWIDRQTNSLTAPIAATGYYEAVLGDGSNFISGSQTYMSFVPWSQIQAINFEVLPRRDAIIYLNIFYHTPQGKANLCASIPFSNPLYREYPQWQPETLSLTNVAGDLEVTLKHVETGHDNNMTSRSRRGGGEEVTYGTNRTDGRNYTLVELKLRPLTNTNEEWQAAGVEISDATGNRSRNNSMSWSGGNTSAFAFMPSLWPGEKAWKLKIDLKRSAGFRPEELLVFTNVPLGELNQTNILGWHTNSNGVDVTFQSIVHRAPLTNNSWSSSQLSEIKLTNSSLPAGTYFDLLRVVWDPGKTNNPESSSWSDTYRDYGFREVPAAAKTGDFVFVVQKSRTVEFTVKPELPKPSPKSNKAN